MWSNQVILTPVVYWQSATAGSAESRRGDVHFQMTTGASENVTRQVENFQTQFWDRFNRHIADPANFVDGSIWKSLAAPDKSEGHDHRVAGAKELHRIASSVASTVSHGPDIVPLMEVPCLAQVDDRTVVQVEFLGERANGGSPSG